MDDLFIKIFDEKTAEQLNSVGFSYIREKYNNQDVYVFPQTTELIESLNQLFNVVSFVCESKLRF